jgi:glycerophosphoryl diester phosphodiesterase
MLPLQDLYQGRTLKLAHRGARHAAPENTLPAFQRAVEMGADGFELDVQLTFDDVPVVMHGFDLKDVTDASGLTTEYTLEQIKELDAGAHFDAEFAGTQIPTLSEVLDAFPEQIVDVELKSLTPSDTGLERAVVEVIRKHRAEKRVIISSFNPFCLRRTRRLAPELPIGYLTDADLGLVLRKGWLLLGVKREAIHPNYTIVDEKFMAWARERNWRVNAWTVDEANDMKQLLALGVDAIITDRPDVLRAVLEGEA